MYDVVHQFTVRAVSRFLTFLIVLILRSTSRKIYILVVSVIGIGNFKPMSSAL